MFIKIVILCIWFACSTVISLLYSMHIPLQEFIFEQLIEYKGQPPARRHILHLFHQYGYIFSKFSVHQRTQILTRILKNSTPQNRALLLLALSSAFKKYPTSAINQLTLQLAQNATLVLSHPKSAIMQNASQTLQNILEIAGSEIPFDLIPARSLRTLCKYIYALDAIDTLNETIGPLTFDRNILTTYSIAPWSRKQLKQELNTYTIEQLCELVTIASYLALKEEYTEFILRELSRKISTASIVPISCLNALPRESQQQIHKHILTLSGIRSIVHATYNTLRGIPCRQIIPSIISDKFTAIKWSPQGDKLATLAAPVSRSGLKIWNAQTGECLHSTLGHLSRENILSWSPDGKYIASNSLMYSKVKIWEANTGTCTKMLTDTIFDITSISWSPDNTRIAITHNNEDIIIWNLKTTRYTKYPTEYSNNGIKSAQWLPDNKTIAITPAFKNIIDLRDADTGISIHQCELDNHDTRHNKALYWSPLSTFVASCPHNSTTITIWDPYTGQRQQRMLFDHQEPITEFVWSPNEELLASYSLKDATIRVWHVYTGKQVYTIASNTPYISALSWSPDGQYLAGCTKTGNIYIWHLFDKDLDTYLTQKLSLAELIDLINVYKQSSTNIVHRMRMHIKLLKLYEHYNNIQRYVPFAS